VGGVAEGGGPGVEEHVDGRERAEGEEFATRSVGREFFDAQVAAEHVGDDRDLFGVSERLRAGEDVFGAGVAWVAQGVDGYGGDVALVDRRGGNGEIRPAHDVARANLRRPPKQSIGGEHAGAEKGPRNAGGFDGAFDLFEHGAKQIGLLKERVRRFERSGKVNDAARAPGDALQSGSCGGGRGGPHEKDGAGIVEARIKSFGNGEIAANDFDLRRQIGGARIAGQGAHWRAGGDQLRDDLAADRAGGADYENGIHGRTMVTQ